MSSKIQTIGIQRLPTCGLYKWRFTALNTRQMHSSLAWKDLCANQNVWCVCRNILHSNFFSILKIILSMTASRYIVGIIINFGTSHFLIIFFISWFFAPEPRAHQIGVVFFLQQMNWHCSDCNSVFAWNKIMSTIINNNKSSYNGYNENQKVTTWLICSLMRFNLHVPDIIAKSWRQKICLIVRSYCHLRWTFFFPTNHCDAIRFFVEFFSKRNLSHDLDTNNLQQFECGTNEINIETFVDTKLVLQ